MALLVVNTLTFAAPNLIVEPDISAWPNITANVSLSNDAGGAAYSLVSGIQFDISYDSSQLDPTASPQLGTASSSYSLSSSIPAHGFIL